MEDVLRSHLVRLTDRYVQSGQLQVTTLSQRAAGDWRFLARIAEGGRFTVRKYDEVIAWFSDHWPEGAEWPSDVPRPSVSEPAPEVAA